MEFCHNNPDLESPAIQKLGQFIQEWHTRWDQSTPDFERFA
jgi:hypothetical protein